MRSGVVGNTSTNAIGRAPPGGDATPSRRRAARAAAAPCAAPAKICATSSSSVIASPGADEAEALEQRAEQLVVGARLADRRDDRAGCRTSASRRSRGAARGARGTSVAGSTTSASIAVSVITCSWTTTNRSSRAQLLDQRALIGRGRGRVAVVDEQASIARIAQRRAARSTSPLMLTSRVGGLGSAMPQLRR